MRAEFERIGGVAGEDAMIDEFANQAAHGGEVTALGGDLEFAGGEAFEKGGQGGRIKRAGFDPAGAAKLLEVAQVAAVGVERVAAEAAFDGLAGEMAIDRFIPRRRLSLHRTPL